MALDRDLKTLVTDRVDRSRVGKSSAILRVRLAITVFVVFLGVGWWAWAGGTKAGLMYNPGHVTRVHASFEQDCAACHDGNGKGGFSKTISDNACLKCHDGSIHHPNQLTAPDPHHAIPGGLVMAVSDPLRPANNMSRSASCVACHVEHRDEATLLASDDAHCTQCHAALGKASTKPPAVQAKVVAFNAVDHPNFGRALMKPDPVDGKPRLFDPTVLKFDHRKHLSLSQLADPNSCVTCHVTANVPADLAHPDVPPFPTKTSFADDRPFADGKYMLPVSFDKHCIGCHQLELPGTVAGVEVKNEDDEKVNKDVKPAISGVILRHRDLAEVRDQIVAEVRSKLPTGTEGFEVPDAGDASAEIKALPPEQKWVRLNLNAMADDVAGAIGRRSLGQTFDPAAMKLPDTPTADQLTIAKLTAYYTAQAVFGGKNACVSCHEVSGQLPAADVAATPTPLATAPTNIPDSPQHWFNNSVFDHSKHTNMSCVECHSTFSSANLTRISATADPAQQAAEARTVSETSFVNSPNMSWPEWTSTDGKVTSKTRSCVECHHPDQSGNRGAGSACITCHQFHDRTKEVRPASAIAKR